MSQRDQYDHGVPCWIDTLQPDVDASLAFYSGLFGWEFDGPGDMPGGGRYFVARLRGRDVVGVGSRVEGAPQLPSWSMYVSVNSADEVAASAHAAGGAIINDPFDAPPAGRMAVVADPAGAVFCVWEPGQRQGAQLVNEPGAWAMSHLNTPDLERATAFYGEVFGWTTESFGEITMFRLPGYLGGEPQQPVSREVVATMGAAGPDVPPHWSANLWDHDVDATAAKAVELGGAVVAPPFDTPISRMAVLADPQGVAFSISNVPGRVS
jgi:uncharacterized protein